jgi:PKD repeat protein
MKRIIFFALFLPLLLVSCHKDPEPPEAHFSTNTIEPEVGQNVLFTNESINGTGYEWDFGDGFTSSERDPVHWYSSNGTYDVILTVFGEEGMSDQAQITLTVVIPTLLEIEVREYYDEYIVPDASVLLYPSITDWDNQLNSVAEGFTDEDGITVFAGLDNYAYYVDVWEQNHDNYTLRDEDYMTFIRTPDVIPHKINRFIAWVDYVEHTKGALRGTKSARIIGFERKAEVKRQPESGVDTEGWQELLKRSVQVKK